MLTFGSNTFGSTIIIVPIDGEILGCPFSVFVDIRMLDDEPILPLRLLPRHKIGHATCGYLLRDPLPLRNHPKLPSVPIQTLWMHAADSRSDFLSIDAKMAMDTVRQVYPRANGDFTQRYHAVDPTSGNVESYRELWSTETIEGEQEGWWLRATGTHSDKGIVYAGCIIRASDFAQGFLKTETGIGVARWSNTTVRDKVTDGSTTNPKEWQMIMAAGDQDEVVALNFWLDGEWEDDMVEGQIWRRSVRSMELEWRCAKLFEW